MTEARLLRLENEISSLKPSIERHEATIEHANTEIKGIKRTTAGIFNRLDEINNSVMTMPQRVGDNIQACRSELEKNVKEHVKESYVKKEHAIMPRHIILAGVIISAVMSGVTYINARVEKTPGNSVSELIEKVQSGEITINKHDPSSP